MKTRSKVVVLPLIVVLTGCVSKGTVPEIYVNPSLLTAKLNCELREAAMQNNFLTDGEGWVAGVTLSYFKQQDLSMSANGSQFRNLNEDIPPTTMTLGISGSQKNANNETADVTYQVKLNELAENDCQSTDDLRRLAGGFGIPGWAGEVSKVGLEPTVKIAKLSYSTKFSVERSTGGSLAIASISVGNSLFGLGGGLSKYGKRENSVVILFSKLPPKPAKGKPGQSSQKIIDQNLNDLQQLQILRNLDVN